MSLSLALLALFGLLRRRRQRFPLFSLLLAMQLTVGLFPAWQDQVENATGLTFFAPELDGKRLELLKEAVPKVTRVAFLWRVPTARADLFKEAEAVAKTLGLRLQSLGG